MTLAKLIKFLPSITGVLLALPLAVHSATDDAQWFLEQPKENYALMLMITSDKYELTKIVDKYQSLSYPLKYAQVIRDNEEQYLLLYGSFEDSDIAERAKKTLPRRFQRLAWPKYMGVLQQELKEVHQYQIPASHEFSEDTNIEDDSVVTLPEVYSTYKVPEEAPEQALEQSLKSSLEKGLEEKFNHTLEKVLDESVDRALEKSFQKAVDKGINKAIDKISNDINMPK